MSTNVDPIAASMAASLSGNTAPAGVDPIAAAMRREATGQAAYTVADQAGTSADRAVQDQRLAKRYKVPVDTVAAFPEDFRRHALMEDARNNLANAPALADHINQNPGSAPVVGPDLPGMAQQEQFLSEWKPSIGERITDWLRQTFTPGLDARNRAAAANETAAAVNHMTPEQARAAVGGGSEIPDQAIGGLVHGASFGLIPNSAGDATTTAGQIGAGLGELGGALLGPFKLGEMALTKVPGFTALTTPLEGQAFVKGAAKTIGGSIANMTLGMPLANLGDILDSHDMATAAEKLGLHAKSGVEMGLLFGGLGRALPARMFDHDGKFAPDASVLSTLAQTAGRVAGVNAGMDMMNGTSMDDSRPLAQKVFDYGLNTFFALHAAGYTEGGWLHDAAKADVATQDFQRLAALSEMFNATKAKALDPEGFHSFLQLVADRYDVPDLYVKAADLTGAMEKAGVSYAQLAEALPDVAKELQQGLDVRIPMADWGAKIVGSPLDEPLREHLRADPKGSTYGEAQTFYQEMVKDLGDRAKKTLEERAQDDAFQASAKQVYDDAEKKFTALGVYAPEQAKLYARMLADFHIATASRRTNADGSPVMPHEHAAEFPIDIHNGMFVHDTPAGNTYGSHLLHPELQDLADRYDNGDEQVATGQDLLREVQALHEEGKLPPAVKEAADKYQAALQEDFTQLGGRGDTDSAERAFREAIGTALGDYPTDHTAEQGRARKALEAASQDGSDNSFEQRKGPGSDVNHKREKGSGRYVGAPDWVGSSPQKLTKMRRALDQLAVEGTIGRFWYEKSARAVLALTHGNKEEAEKFVGLLAIFSPSTGAAPNTTHALTAWYQWKSGLPIRAGRFPEEMGRKATEWLVHNRDWGGVKTNNFYQDLMEEIDPAKVDHHHSTMDMWIALAGDYGSKVLDQGPKYQFMQREIKRIADATGWRPHQVQAAIWTAARGRIMGSEDERKAWEKANGILVQDPETQLWGVAKGREYDHYRAATRFGMAWQPHDVPSGIQDAMAGQKQYTVDVKGDSLVFADKKTGKAVKFDNLPTTLQDALNAAGVPLKGQDVTQKLIDESDYDFGHALAERSAQVSWEATPGVSTGVLPGIHNAPVHQQVEYLHAIRQALADEHGRDLIDQHLGLLTNGGLEGFSGWQGKTSVGVQNAAGATVRDGAVTDLSRQLINLAADIRGLLLYHGGIAWHFPIYNGNKYGQNGAGVNLGRPLTERENAALYHHLALHLGHTMAPPIPTETGFRVLNFPDAKFALMGETDKAKIKSLQADLKASNDAFHEAVGWAIRDAGLQHLVQTHERFETDGDLRENDWTHGDAAYRSRIAEASRSLHAGQGADSGTRFTDLQKWIDDDLRPKVEAVNRDFANRYGWDKPQQPGGVSEPGPGYTTDVLGNPLPSTGRDPVPGPAGDHLRGPGDSGGRGVPQRGRAARFSPIDAVPGVYLRRTELVKESTRTLGTDRIRTPEEAAHAFSFLARSTRERLSVLVTDKNGRPIALLAPTHGHAYETNVDWQSIATEAFRLKGAAHLWVGHNHPTGSSRLSDADRNAADRLDHLFHGTGIETHGILAVGGGAEQEGRPFQHFHKSQVTDGTLPTAHTETKVPVVERLFTKHQGASDPIDGSTAVPVALKLSEMAGNQDGLMLLDYHFRPVGFLPFDLKGADKLRRKGGVDEIARGISMANASSAIPVTSEPLHGPALQNLVSMLGAYHVTVPDIVNRNDPLSYQQRSNPSLPTPQSTFNQGRGVPLWRSALLDTLEALPTKKTGGQTWLNQLRKGQGVKAEELEAVDLPEFLGDRKDVTKEEIQAYLENSGVRLREYHYSNDVPPSVQRIFDEHSDLAYSVAMDPGDDSLTFTDPEGEVIGYDDLPSVIQEKLDADPSMADHYGETHFDKYRRPGGAGYTELLLTLPRSTGPNVYRSGHWTPTNVVGHVRFHTTIDANRGKNLFIDELQSDWGQDGRKYGIRTQHDDRIDADIDQKIKALEPAIQEARSRAEAALQELASYDRQHPAGADAKAEERAALDAARTETLDGYNARVRQVEQLRHEQGRLEGKAEPKVPAAPWIAETNQWTALLLKRAMRYAADHGFDSVSLMNGAEAADMYKLRNQVEYLSFNPDTGKLRGWDKSRKEVLNTTKTAEELPNLIGKEVAQKLLATEPVMGQHNLEGEDLEVGGEGMKAFYDRIVPDQLKSLLKKVGGKLELIEGKDGQQDLGFHITPEMREKLQQPQTLFQGQEEPRGRIHFGSDITQRPSVMEILKDHNASTAIHELGHYFLEVYANLAGRENAPAGVAEDMNKLLSWFGVKDLATWQAMTPDQRRPYHEQFARAWEAKALSGEAPTVAQAAMFGRFRAWLTRLYDSVKDLKVTLNPEVEGVLNRMLATEKAIQNTEQVRGLRPMFETRPEGMTDESWAAYQADNSAATESAIQNLQGKSLRDMQWLSNARDKALRGLRRQAAAARKALREEVTAEVDRLPVYQAERWLKTGEMVDDQGVETKVLEGHKLNLDQVKALYPESGLDNPDLSKLRGLTHSEGLDPELVAGMFGYRSADELIKDLVHRDRKAAIEARTDQRMLERHGELVDQQSIEKAANAAVHNALRLRVLAREVSALDKAVGSAALLAKAAQEAAERAIAAKRIRDLRPDQYEGAETRAGRASWTAFKKGETAEAAEHKRQQLLNHALAKAALDAQAEVEKVLKYVARFQKVQLLKRIDVEERNQILALLEQYDFRKNPTDKPTRAQRNLQQWLESQQQAGYAPSVDTVALAPRPRTEYRDLTMEQLRGLHDALRSLEKIGRSKLYAEWQGQRISLDNLVQDVFVPKMQAAGEKFTPEQLYVNPDNQHPGLVRHALDRLGSFMRGMIAELKPQYFKANHFDQHEILGPFHELFNAVFEATYRKIDMTRAQSNTARALADRLGREWQRSLTDHVPNDVLVDPTLSAQKGTTELMTLTRDNLLQMVAHAGNESNFDKLVKGYGWKPEEVWKFLSGKLTAQDVEAVKGMWQMANAHWEQSKGMYERLGQVAPPKIEPRPFKLKLADGSTVELPGGYMPVRYDPLRSKLGARKEAQRVLDPAADRMGHDFFGRDTTTNGSMNARKDGYTDALDLSHAGLERALAETIHDLAYRETLINTHKILTHAQFRAQFLKTYGRENYDSMLTWLGRIANSETVDRQVGQLGKVLRYTRQGMVINAIAFRLSTVLKHGSAAALKSAGYFAGGGTKYYVARQAAMASDYSAQVAEAVQKFPEIRARALQQDRDYREMSSSLFQPESKISRAERAGHSAVAWADLFTATATAHAAYDWAITEGIPEKLGGPGRPMTHEEAVRYANQVVREAHGSQLESSRSNIMTAPSEAVRMFTTLYGFMNNTFGQTADMASKLRTAGISNPAVCMRALMALVVPAAMTALITEGAPEDDKSWAAWMAKAFASEEIGSLPFARDLLSFLEGYRHAGVIGAEAWLSGIAQPMIDAWKAAQGQEVQGGIAHTADALGMGLHIPGLGQLGKTIQYLYDVHTGREQPESAAELAQGATVGSHKH